MTTTSQQPPPGQPGPERRSGSGRPALSGAFLTGAVGGVVAIGAMGWFFLAGPGSSSGLAVREVEETLQDVGNAECVAEFNSFMGAANRVPQELVDTITASGEQTGTDLDAMCRESIAGSFPEDLR